MYISIGKPLSQDFKFKRVSQKSKTKWTTIASYPVKNPMRCETRDEGHERERENFELQCFASVETLNIEKRIKYSK